MADLPAGIGQFVVLRPRLHSCGNIQMGLGQGVFCPASGLADLVLDRFHAGANLLLAPTVAHRRTNWKYYAGGFAGGGR